MTLLDQLRQLANHRLGRFDGLLLALEREHVSAQEQVAVEMCLERAEDRVTGPGELACDRVVELELPTHAFPLAPPALGQTPVSRPRAPPREPSQPSSPGPCPGGSGRRSRRSRRLRSPRARRRRVPPEGRPGSARPRAPPCPQAPGARRRGTARRPRVAACARAGAPPARRLRLPWPPSAARRA